jgi:hypothetical protein
MSAEAVACLKCGHPNPQEARYCSICGSPMAGQVAPSEQGTPLSPGPGPSVIPARDLGELIGETFAVYRANFWPFALIALVPQVPVLVTLLTPTWLDVLLALVSLFLSILASGAAVHAVAQLYLGRPVDVSQCFKRAWHRVLSIVVVTVVTALALIGSVVLMIIVVGIPLFFFLLVVWFFAVEAIMIEDRRLLAALGRSRELVRGSWWRVFGIGVVFVLVLIGLSIVGLIPTAIIAPSSSTAGDFLATAVSVLVAPIFFIGRTLVYLDLRVRKEGYTLAALSSEVGPRPGPAPGV